MEAEEYPEILPSETISNSGPGDHPEGVVDDSLRSNNNNEVEDIEIEVPFPEVKGLKYTKSGFEESWKGAKKQGDRKPHVKFSNNNNRDQSEEYPEDQEDPNVEDPTSQKSRGGKVPITKVAIRRLPPAMTKDEFIEAVQPLPEYNYTSMHNPDKEWGFDARSVAHINFLDEADALWFIERFTGYQFIDEKGDEYVSICDSAIHPGVPKPGKQNPRKGTLEQSEHYLEFLNKYEEKPYPDPAYDDLLTSDTEGEITSQKNTHIITPEMMLAELEERTAAKDVETTPLLEFLRNKKAASRKERDLRRQREKRSFEKREASEIKYRELKRERKREKRDKERRERREKEKLEREAKTKGMTITYSKSGKVTRWSTNSSPFPKKTDEEQAQTKAGNDGADGKLSSVSEDKETHGSGTNTFKDNSAKTDKYDNPVVKKKIVNPLKSKGRPSDSKRHESFEEKSRFCKPFPIKDNKKKEYTRTDEGEGDKNKPSSSSKSEKSDTNSKDAIPPISDAQQASTGKKKIIKKIIRVRRVKPKGDEGSEGPAKEGSTSTTESVESSLTASKNEPDPRPTPGRSSNSSKSKVDNSKSKENAKPKSGESSKSRGDNGNSKFDEKLDTKKSTGDGTSSSESKQSSLKTEEENARRRRARPDMQIYRPGGRLRKPDTKSADKDDAKES